MPNISRGKENQTMKIGQLIEYNLKSIFVKKSYTKCGGETNPRLLVVRNRTSWDRSEPRTKISRKQNLKNMEF